MTAWTRCQPAPASSRRSLSRRGPRPASMSTPKPSPCSRLALPLLPLARTVNCATIRVTPRQRSVLLDVYLDGVAHQRDLAGPVGLLGAGRHGPNAGAQLGGQDVLTGHGPVMPGAGAAKAGRQSLKGVLVALARLERHEFGQAKVGGERQGSSDGLG